MKLMTEMEARRWRGIGWRAAVLRQLAGLDQVEAATKAGITPATWARMESGQRCQDGTIFDVAHAFGLPNPLWLKYGVNNIEDIAATAE